MSAIENLVENYQKLVRLPWEHSIAGPQRVWIAVYDPPQERRLRLRLGEFEMVTKKAGHGWQHIDLTDAFAQWVVGHDYRNAFFETPEDMELTLEEFAAWLAQQVTNALKAREVDKQAVVAVSGVGALFGVASVSRLIRDVEGSIRGRLLVFFPGEYTDGIYRLLDARDGWGYLAVVITETDGK